MQEPQFLGVLRQAVLAGRQVVLGYADRERTETSRTVHPLGVVEKGSTWYLVADTTKGLRTFRVGRVRSVEVTDDPVVRPPDFDLAEAWETIAAAVEEKRASVRAVVRTPERGVGGLRSTFGPSTKVLGPVAGVDGVVDVEIGGGSYWSIARQLAPWTGWVDVVGPPELHEQLADLGRRLVASYA